MIISMPTIARSQQRYDHRLRNLVQRTGDVTVATDPGVPRSTARGWLGKTPTVVVCLDVKELTESELRQEVLKRVFTLHDSQATTCAFPLFARLVTAPATSERETHSLLGF